MWAGESVGVDFLIQGASLSECGGPGCRAQGTVEFVGPQWCGQSQPGRTEEQAEEKPLGCGSPHVKQMGQLLAGVMSLSIGRNPGVKIMVSVSVGRDQASGNFPEGPR